MFLPEFKKRMWSLGFPHQYYRKICRFPDYNIKSDTCILIGTGLLFCFRPWWSGWFCLPGVSKQFQSRDLSGFFLFSSSWMNNSYPLNFFAICSSFTAFTSFPFSFGLTRHLFDEPVAPGLLFFGIFCLDSDPSFLQMLQSHNICSFCLSCLNSLGQEGLATFLSSYTFCRIQKFLNSVSLLMG